MIEDYRKKGIFLTILGFGMGNYKDGRMEQLADKGNGNYFYIDNLMEAKKVFVNDMRGTLFTIAKDVKLQLEFNPAKVKAYRLIGYENRMLKKEDFADDTKDAGELGADHTVTALYEIIPYGSTEEIPGADDLKYQDNKISPKAFKNKEILTLKLRYKKPDGEKSKLIVHPLVDNNVVLAKTSDNFKFSAAVASKTKISSVTEPNLSSLSRSAACWTASAPKPTNLSFLTQGQLSPEGCPFFYPPIWRLCILCGWLSALLPRITLRRHRCRPSTGWGWAFGSSVCCQLCSCF
jgi:hypothetical protein